MSKAEFVVKTIIEANLFEGRHLASKSDYPSAMADKIYDDLIKNKMALKEIFEENK